VAIVSKGWMLDACVATVIAVAAFYGAYQVAVHGFPYLITTVLPGCYVAFSRRPDAHLQRRAADVSDPVIASGLTVMAVVLTLLAVIVILHIGIVLTRVYLQRRGRTPVLPCSTPLPPAWRGRH
jgi:hypothetical protein